MSPKGRTELKIDASEAKLHEETDFDVQKLLDLQKPVEKCEKPNSETKKTKKIKISVNKMKNGESSETRFPKVSR